MTDDGPDYTCDRMRKVKTMETDQWRDLHAAHTFEQEFDERPPSYNLVTYVCTCGARHTFMQGKDTSL